MEKKRIGIKTKEKERKTKRKRGEKTKEEEENDKQPLKFVVDDETEPPNLTQEYEEESEDLSIPRPQRAQTSQTVFHPFACVYDNGCTRLLLGTMPSPASRKDQFYYGHSQNRFWKVIAAVFGEPVPSSVQEKTTVLLKHHLALWDVLARCTIKGAADASITRVECNDFSSILAQTHITRIYTNGTKAYELYTKHCRNATHIDAIALPSTSPANASCKLDMLISRYSVLKDNE